MSKSAGKVTPVAGQRWVSDSEPELGLGIVLKAEYGRAEIFFPAANEHRHYALGSAPIRRVRFQEGDNIKTHDGDSLAVTSLEDRDGLLIYHAGTREVAEASLSDLISFSKPEDRLMAGQVDDLRAFDLRVESLDRRCRMSQSPARGFVGGRVSLIPHQMFIVGEVASRLVPRVLLADEVGLGKTIEACLILHQLHLTGRAGRILILVPEPLLNQWFVELFRRFHLTFSIFDEERCAAIQQDGTDTNPFLDSQLVLCGIDFLAGSPERARQARAAGWDLLVVDEAHHLEWTPTKASPQYEMVEALSASSPGLLLLTATPQQLGVEGHFARLRLLDPNRYTDLKAFVKESKQYEVVAKAIDQILADKPLSNPGIFSGTRIARHYEALLSGDKAAKDKIVSELLDEFGTGRMMFRNTRAVLSGFPKRKARLIPVAAGSDEFVTKILWLVGLLKKLKNEKVLLICKTSALAEQIAARLQREVKVAVGLFHEGLTLLQRDRNAAFFAEDDGARVLICSEIGSEGRNFQFAHHLVLFDLPDDPELLEQRIGRLDRIGQTDTITIHVPYLLSTGSEVLARWYHEGLDAFEKNLHGASGILKTLGSERDELVESFDAERLNTVLQLSKEERKKIAKKLQRGHDRLLELNSCRLESAMKRIEEIRALDSDIEFEEFFIRMLDQLGLHIEEHGKRSYLLRAGNLQADALPGLTEEGKMVTFDRERALSREDIEFVTADHPLVRGALDTLLGAEVGNSAFAVWKAPGRGGIFLEIHAVVECVAPPALHIDRFLPATPIRIVVDQALADQSEDESVRAASMGKGDVLPILDSPPLKKKHLPAMLAKAQSLAEEKMRTIVDASDTSMELGLQSEIERLEDLRQINDNVRPQEIQAIRDQKAELRKALAAARLRIDSIKLVLRIAEEQKIPVTNGESGRCEGKKVPAPAGKSRGPFLSGQ